MLFRSSDSPIRTTTIILDAIKLESGKSSIL